ncbi:MAG: YdcF family protein [Dorea sp.]|nr:YdcF family protein [Dorea sp.]
MLRQIIFLLCGILCLVYYAALCAALRKWNSTFSRFWLLCGIIFLICRYIDADKMEIVRPYEKLFPAFAAGAAIVFVWTEILIIRGMYARGDDVYTCLIVLGAQVDGKRITDSLQRRLDRAVKYLEEHPDTMVIVSGGRGKGEEIAEAEAMEGYLLEKGIEGKRIRKEDRSRTTKENLIFSQAYIGDMEQPVGIVSNNFHLYRAVCYARKEGYGYPCPLAADCHLLLLPNYMVREFFAVWKMWLTGAAAER